RASRSRTFSVDSPVGQEQRLEESLFRRDAETSTQDAYATQAVSLDILRSFIDWSPFFHAWELRGRYPAIFDDPSIGQHARELFDDAQEILERIIAKKSLTARGAFGFWPANATGDDVDLFRDESRRQKLVTFYFLRQQI